MADDELTKLKIAMSKLETKLDGMSEDVAEIKKTLSDFIEKAESRYAGKWTEKLIVTVGVAIILALVGAALKKLIIP